METNTQEEILKTVDDQKGLDQLKAAHIAGELQRMKKDKIKPNWDKKNRFYETKAGFRHNGPRKTRLINLCNQQLLELAQKGVNGEILLKILGIEGGVFDMTTKQWTGVLSKLKAFRMENKV